MLKIIISKNVLCTLFGATKQLTHMYILSPICRSGFFFFCGDKRPKLKEQNPQATVGDIAKQLGAAWKIMTPEQKAPYEKQSKDDRKRYERDMERYRKGEYHKGVPSPVEDDDDDDDDDDESD